MDTTQNKEVAVTHLMTIAEVAKLARLGRTLLYSEIAAGRLRTVKFGRAVRVRSDDYQAWIDERTREQAG
jgi:excisionase family DNA binding protein